jgi:hypothetical protein
VDPLDGNGSLQPWITGTVNHSHSALADFFFDGEGADLVEARSFQWPGLIM